MLLRKYTVRRDELPDLELKGRKLAGADDRDPLGDGREPYWLELALYKTNVGKYVLASTLHADGNEPRELNSALSFSSARNVYDFLTCEGPDSNRLVYELLKQSCLRDKAFQFVLTEGKGGPETAFGQRPTHRPLWSQSSPESSV
jgi:hypothetical protein